ncbi:MAG: anti-sigma factor [Acidobacteria bacterium]|nr:anti-sigma factor [Acidobacteriota bacterium]
MATDNDLHELASLYVIGALPRADREAFEAHLATCAQCQQDVRTLSPVGEALAYAAPDVEPPADLRQRVLASVGATSSARGRARATAAARTTSPLWSMSGLSGLATAASLLLAVVLGGYAVQLRGRVASLEGRLAQALARVDASERLVAEARRAVSDAQVSLVVLTAPDMARVELAGQAVAPRAAGRAFWSRSRGLVFTASNLPALPAGRTYQLWVVTAQAPVSAGLLKPDPNGAVNVIFTTPSDLQRPTAMAVTIEPDGGVPAPTGAMYLVGAIAGL